MLEVHIRNILIYGSFIGLPIGWLFAMLFAGEMERKFLKKILFVLIMIFTSLIVGLLLYSQDLGEYETWNDGLCPNCQTEWRFSGASHYRSTTYYYYVCDNCGKVIEVTQNFN